MISRSANKGFLQTHYDRLVLAAGLLVLAGGAAFYFMAMGVDPEEVAVDEVARIDRMRPSATGVKAEDMHVLQQASRMTRNPTIITEISDHDENFLASARMVLCKCGKAIPGDPALCPQCPFCGEKQEVPEKTVLDSDGDGLPDEWEKKHGLNANDAADASADADGDGFTNREEYLAKTDPNDRRDHPDYLDSLKIVLPLKETHMPFIFTAANKIPAGWRCEFFDPVQKDDYNRPGRAISAVVGEEIGKSGFVLKGYEAKSVKRAIKGGQGMTKSVDVSEALVERKSDGKKIKLVIAANRKEKPMAVDVQATLVYERGTAKNFEVVAGEQISLSGTKYRVSDIKVVGKTVKVTLENMVSGRKRTLEALEQ